MQAALVGWKRNHNMGKCKPLEELQNGWFSAGCIDVGLSNQLKRCEILAPRQCMINSTTLDKLNH